MFTMLLDVQLQKMLVKIPYQKRLPYLVFLDLQIIQLAMKMIQMQAS